MTISHVEVFGCCKKTTMWIFVYENNDIYSICKEHFYSIAHRCDVKEIIHIKTRIRHEPEEVFKHFPIMDDRIQLSLTILK